MSKQMEAVYAFLVYCLKNILSIATYRLRCMQLAIVTVAWEIWSDDIKVFGKGFYLSDPLKTSAKITMNKD